MAFTFNDERSSKKFPKIPLSVDIMVGDDHDDSDSDARAATLDATLMTCRKVKFLEENKALVVVVETPSHDGPPDRDVCGIIRSRQLFYKFKTTTLVVFKKQEIKLAKLRKYDVLGNALPCDNFATKMTHVLVNYHQKVQFKDGKAVADFVFGQLILIYRYFTGIADTFPDDDDSREFQSHVLLLAAYTRDNDCFYHWIDEYSYQCALDICAKVTAGCTAVLPEGKRFCPVFMTNRVSYNGVVATADDEIEANNVTLDDDGEEEGVCRIDDSRGDQTEAPSEPMGITEDDFENNFDTSFENDDRDRVNISDDDIEQAFDEVAPDLDVLAEGVSNLDNLVDWGSGNIEQQPFEAAQTVDELPYVDSEQQFFEGASKCDNLADLGPDDMVLIHKDVLAELVNYKEIATTEFEKYKEVAATELEKYKEIASSVQGANSTLTSANQIIRGLIQNNAQLLESNKQLLDALGRARAETHGIPANPTN